MIASTDPISDMLARIRNGLAVGRNEINLPYSQIKESVARVLVRKGFLESVKVITEKENKNKTLRIITHLDGANPAINYSSRLSKPGRRLYVQAKRIPVVRRGRGIVVVSTSQGVMSGDEAKSKNLGGELICEVF